MCVQVLFIKFKILRIKQRPFGVICMQFVDVELLLFLDVLYVIIAPTCQRMGGNKNGINMEATGVCNMVLLWGCSHLIICMEYGNYIHFPYYLYAC